MGEPARSAPETPADTHSLLRRALTDASAPVDDLDGTSVRVLDAAFDQLCRVGIQRTTMEDVARRAGVSRITVYRRFTTKDALVEQVVRREFRRYFDQFQNDIKEARSVADRVVLGFVSSLRAIRGNPLIGGLMAAEPGALVVSMVGDDGRTMATVREFVAGQLRTEQRAGTVAGDLDVELAAELMVRISASFLITPSQLVDLDDEAQLADLARRFLVPLLETSSASARRP